MEEALAQPFLAEYYDPADEPTAEKPFQYEVSPEPVLGIKLILLSEPEFSIEFLLMLF